MPECPLYNICEIEEPKRDPVACNNYTSCAYYVKKSGILHDIDLMLGDTIKVMDQTIRTIDDTLIQVAFIREHRKELF